MPDDPLAEGKGWPGMAPGQMRGAALAAALAVITCERARDCPRALAVLAGPSRHGHELAGMSRPAAERAAAGRPLVRAGRGRRHDELAAVASCRADAAGDPRQVCPERRKEGLVMRVQWQ